MSGFSKEENEAIMVELQALLDDAPEPPTARLREYIRTCTELIPDQVRKNLRLSRVPREVLPVVEECIAILCILMWSGVLARESARERACYRDLIGNLCVGRGLGAPGGKWLVVATDRLVATRVRLDGRTDVSAAMAVVEMAGALVDERELS